MLQSFSEFVIDRVSSEISLTGGEIFQMKQLEPYWGRRALDFVEAIEASKTAASVISQFEKVIGELGFHAYIMAGIPMSGQSLAELTIANGWPVEWFELYNLENLHEVDPIPRHCFNSLNPFEWKDVSYDRERDLQAHGVMMRARDFGLCEGFCIPIHYDDGIGAVSIAGERPYLDAQTRGALHLIGVFTHGRMRALSRPGAATFNRRLSGVEAEVLRWAARGKTAWETGQILGISERNVRWHIEEAQRKLMTNNKTATVAAAIVNREILI
jgi:LuxR family transcriptional regulator, quorum-sensing system regulator BjaR1